MLEDMIKINFPETLFLQNTNWQIVKIQRGKISAIYKSEDRKTFLRVGQKEKVEKDMLAHKKLTEQGFPVATILQNGMEGELAWYTETSLGDLHFGEIFKTDMEKFGRISDENFRKFLDIILAYAKAQIANLEPVQNWKDFEKGIFLEGICKEFPELREKIMQKFAKCKEKLSGFTFAFMQGDLNSFNILLGGIIDFETNFFAPFLFDVLGCIESDTWMPDELLDGKYNNWFRFSESQKTLYMKEISDLYFANNLPDPNNFLEEFRFLKGIWWSYGMGLAPEFQKFRIEKLKNLL